MERDFGTDIGTLIKVNVRLLSGRSFTLDADSTQPLAHLRLQIFAAIGLSPHRQRLFLLDGTELPECQSLTVAGVSGIGDLSLLAQRHAQALLSEQQQQQVLALGRHINSVASKDAGGSECFCAECVEAAGDLELLEAAMDVLNTNRASDGGSSHIAKMLVSTTRASFSHFRADNDCVESPASVAMVAYVPSGMLATISPIRWICAVLEGLGVRPEPLSPQHKCLTISDSSASIIVTPEMANCDCLGSGTVQDSIGLAVAWLRTHGLVNDDECDHEEEFLMDGGFADLMESGV